MKVLFVALACCAGFLSFGQENMMYTIKLESMTPSLSFIDNPHISSGNYTLMEVNLTVDLRKEALRENVSMVVFPKNQIIEQKFNVYIPENNFRIYANGRNSSNNNRTGLKNTAYKDASLYSGPFCPITGIAY